MGDEPKWAMDLSGNLAILFKPGEPGRIYVDRREDFGDPQPVANKILEMLNDKETR